MIACVCHIRRVTRIATARLAEAARGALEETREPQDRLTKNASIIEKPAGILTGGPF